MPTESNIVRTIFHVKLNKPADDAPAFRALLAQFAVSAEPGRLFPGAHSVGETLASRARGSGRTPPRLDLWYLVLLADPSSFESAIASFDACADVTTLSKVYEDEPLSDPPQELLWSKCFHTRQTPLGAVRVNMGVCQELAEVAPGDAVDYNYARVVQRVGDYELLTQYDGAQLKWPTGTALQGTKVFFFREEDPYGSLPTISSIEDVGNPSNRDQRILFDPAGESIPTDVSNTNHNLVYPCGSCKAVNWGPGATHSCPDGECTSCPGYVSSLYPVRDDLPTSAARGFQIESAWGPGPGSARSNAGTDRSGVRVMMAHRDTGVMYTHRDYGGPTTESAARDQMLEGLHASLVFPRESDWSQAVNPYTTTDMHGTNTSSIIVAQSSGSDHDIVGVAPELLFMPFDLNDTYPPVFMGAVNNGAALVSISIAQSPSPNPTYEPGSSTGDAVAYAYDAGVMIFWGHRLNDDVYSRAYWKFINAGQALYSAQRHPDQSSWGDNLDSGSNRSGLR